MPTIPQSPVSVNGIIASDANLAVTDITTNNVTSTAHGFAPKSPASASQFLNGAATPAFAAVTDANLSVSDITTNDATASAHGFAPKAWAAAWATWTPTWTNITVNNGTVDAKYMQVGKTITYRVALTFGTTTSVSGNARVTVPITSVTYTQYAAIGRGSANDSGGAAYPLTHAWVSTTAAEIFCEDSTSARNVYNFVTSTIPFTWGSGDILFLTGTYEAA